MKALVIIIEKDFPRFYSLFFKLKKCHFSIQCIYSSLCTSTQKSQTFLHLDKSVTKLAKLLKKNQNNF